MLMDNPSDWQARISSLQAAVSETIELVTEVVNAHADDILGVFGATMENDSETPFHAIRKALGDTTPREFLALPAEQRTNVPPQLRDCTKKDYYQLVTETMQINTCIKLLEALQHFSKDGFSFFLDGYYTKKNLPVTKDAPPRSVMRTVVRQVSTDLGVIQAAVNQRRRLDGRATRQARTLTMADQLSDMALSLALEAGYLPEDTVVVTYLDKGVRARLMPYYNALLISVAYATIFSDDHPSRDFLAIPHEVGHHLFWNGRQPHSDVKLRDAMLQKAADAGIDEGDWRLNWLEEMFADAYALLLAGPVIILNFQDMLDDDMSSHFREDTDKHPIPEIRPFILTEILRRIQDSSGQIVYAHECDKLDANWRTWLNAHPLQQNYRLRGEANEMSGQAVVTAVAPLINVIIETLQDIVPTSRDHSGMEGSDDVSKLYTEFQSFIMPEDDNQLVNMFLEGTGTTKQLNDIIDSYSEIPFHEYIHRLTKQKPDKISSAQWLHYLRSYGWSDEGPMGDPGGTTAGGGTSTSGNGSSGSGNGSSGSS